MVLKCLPGLLTEEKKYFFLHLICFFYEVIYLRVFCVFYNYILYSE